MKTTAAVAFAAGQPLEIVEVDLEGPRSGEVLVEIKATGICYTDAFTLSGDDPEGVFPAILGHEGAGVVVKIGPGVTSVKVGDTYSFIYTRMPSVRVLPASKNKSLSGYTQHTGSRTNARWQQPIFL